MIYPKPLHAETIESYAIRHSDPLPSLIARLEREASIRLINPRMLSGAEQGQFLMQICRMIRPQRVLEIGTFAGFSALCMAHGMQPGTTIDTIEIDDELEDFILSYFEQDDTGVCLNLHIGDALQLIPTFEKCYDLVFIDADKRSYIEYYELVLPKVRPGGFILADNTLWDGKVIEPLDPKDRQTAKILEFNRYIADDLRVGKMILSLRDGLTLIYKK